MMLTILTSERWRASKNQYYTQRFVDIEDGGDYLYFNGPTEVYRIHKTTLQQEKVTTIIDNSQIYSIRFQNDVLLIGTNTDIERDFVDFVEYNVPDVHMVSFIVQDKILYRAYYTHDSKVIPPTKISVPGYQFVSWQNVPDKVVGDCSVWANMEDRTKPLTIRFMVDGEIYYEYTGMYGELIQLPNNPVKKDDQTHNYYFMTWDGYHVGMTINQDVTFTAQFKAEAKIVHLRFYQNGSLISNVTVNAGSQIPFPSCPKNITLNGTTLVFIGWDTDETIAYADASINAVYAEPNKMCSVKYYIAGQLVYEDKVIAGTELSSLQNVTINDDTYIFNGWISNYQGKYVVNDVRFDAIIEPIPKSNHSINTVAILVVLGVITLIGGIVIIARTKEKRS
jgi:hypothetical protein